MADDLEGKPTRSQRASKRRAESRGNLTAGEPISPPDKNEAHNQKTDSLVAEQRLNEEADELANLAREVSRIDGDPRIEQQLIASYFEGPLPPASELRKYNDILPGLAERIVSHRERQLIQAEVEAKERRERQRMTLEADIKLRARGQVIAALVIFADFGIAVLALLKDQPTAAAIFGLPGLAIVLVVFLGGSDMRRRSGLEQAQAFKDALEQLVPRRTNSMTGNDELDR